MILAPGIRPLLRLDAVGILGLAALAYALVSAHSFFDVAWLASLALSFVLGWRLRQEQVRRIWSIGIGALILNLLLALLSDWTGLTWGLFGNPNFFGIACAVGMAGAIVYEWYLAALVLGSGVALSQSRTAYLSVGAMLFAWTWKRSKAISIALALACLVALTFLSGTQNKLDSITQRFGIWFDALDHLSLFGFGWGAFFDAYWSWSVHRLPALIRPAHVYNDYLEIVFNLGLGSILFWAFLALCLEDTSGPTLVLWAFGAAALTHFPLSIFPCAQLCALALGQLYQSKGGFHGSLAFNPTTLPQHRPPNQISL